MKKALYPMKRASATTLGKIRAMMEKTSTKDVVVIRVAATSPAVKPLPLQ